MLLRERSNKRILSATLLGGKVIKILSTTWLGEDGRFGGCFMTGWFDAWLWVKEIKPGFLYKSSR
jgi:hypothetical protein